MKGYAPCHSLPAGPQVKQAGFLPFLRSCLLDGEGSCCTEKKDVWGDGRAQEGGGRPWGWSQGSSGLCRSRCQSCPESAHLLGQLPALPKARSHLGSLGAASLGHGASGFPEPRPPGLQGAGLRNSGFPFRLPRVPLSSLRLPRDL